MTATATPAHAPAVETPPHPLGALATFELVGYRRQLENAIALYGARHPVPPVRADLQALLDAVLSEQDDRARIARA
jgi:hypothetical protein